MIPAHAEAPGGPASSFDARQVPRAIRLAMRLLELETLDTPAVAVLAARVGLSTAHFSRVFAAAMGEAPAAYGRRIRLDHAVSRLLFDPAPMDEIARVFGFESQAAFNRAFRRQHGAAPRTVVDRLRAASAGRAPLPNELPVHLIKRPAETAVARRFFGADLDDHWRRFEAELPRALARHPRRAGMFYDLPTVTPPRHRRYDCAIPLADAAALAAVLEQGAGLDAVELPGGLHAEVRACVGSEAVAMAIGYLYRVWLPRQEQLAPEGDPMVHRLGEGQDEGFTATIRLRRLSDAPAWNMAPLARTGGPAGTGDLASVGTLDSRNGK